MDSEAPAPGASAQAHFTNSPERPRTRSPSGDHEGLAPAQLIELAEEVHTTFDSGRDTLESHLDACLLEHKVKTISDETFIRQVVFGVARYSKMLDSVMKALFHYCGGVVLRKDRPTYRVFAYLAILRLDELGPENFSMLASSQPAQKMLPFLEFLFNEKHLKDDLTEEWLHVFERGFVTECTDKLLANRPALEPLFNKLRHKTYLHQKAEQAAKDGATFTITLASKTTKPAPFNLTPSKPKPPPRDPEAEELAEISAHAPVARPAPPRLEGLTKEEKAIQELKNANRAAVISKYPDLGSGPAKLRTDLRPGTRKIDELRAATEAAEAAACMPAPSSKPPPPPAEAIVRVNAAAILREDATLRRRQKEEAESLKRYEAELRDDAEFQQWRTQKQAEDEDLRLQHVAERREAAKQSREAMIAASKAQLADKTARSRTQREAAAAAAAAAARRAATAAAANIAQRDAIREERGRAMGAKARVTSERSNQAAEVRAEVRKGLARAADAAAQDRAEREDLVRQIRAVEKVPFPRTKRFDRTETGGHRLLDEMSIVELKARLDLVNRQNREAVEATRAENLRKKEARIARLTDKAKNLGRIRQLAGAQASARRRQAAAAAEAAAKEEVQEREKRVVQVVEKLTAKRQAQAEERARIAAESKRVAFMQQQQAAGASQVEESRFLSVRDGLERVLDTQQHKWLQETQLLEKTKQTARKIDLNHAAKLRRAKVDFGKEYDQKLDSLRKDQHTALETDMVKKKAAAAAQRRAEQQQRDQLAAKRASEPKKPMTIQERLQELAEQDLCL